MHYTGRDVQCTASAVQCAATNLQCIATGMQCPATAIQFTATTIQFTVTGIVLLQLHNALLPAYMYCCTLLCTVTGVHVLQQV